MNESSSSSEKCHTKDPIVHQKQNILFFGIIEGGAVLHPRVIPVPAGTISSILACHCSGSFVRTGRHVMILYDGDGLLTFCATQAEFELLEFIMMMMMMEEK